MKDLKAKAAIVMIITLTLALNMTFQTKRSAVGAVATRVSVDPHEVSINTSQTFTVDVTITDVENLWSLEIALSWNPSVLHLESIDVRCNESDGVLNNPSFVFGPDIYEEQGRCSIAALSYPPAVAFNGSGTIARFTFNATNAGFSEMELIQTDLYDWPPPERDPRISQPIPHDTFDGSCEVLPEFPALAMVALLVLATVFSCVLSKRLVRQNRSFSLRSQAVRHEFIVRRAN